MLITRNQDPFRFGTRSSKPCPGEAKSRPQGDSVSLGESRPTPLTYVPTGAGTAAIGGSAVGVGAGVGLLLNALTGNSGLAVGAGALSGLIAGVFVGSQLGKGVEETYAQTGEGSVWMRPAFTAQDITGMPPTAIGVRGLS